MSERFGDYELVGQLYDFDTAILWSARDPSGAPCDLIVFGELADDVEEAFYRGDVIPRWRSTANAIDDARFAKLRAGNETLRANGRNAAVFAHAPLVTVGELVSRACAERGLALPLACTIARDAVDAFALAHAAGRRGFTVVGVGVDGRVRVFDSEPLTARDDIATLGRFIATLTFGESVPREGIAVRVTSAIAWMLDRENRPPLSALQELLDADELAWTKWTPEQVVAELRALFPDLESRR